MNPDSIPEEQLTEKSVEEDKYSSRYNRKTPWNDDSYSDDSDVVSISSLDTVENDNETPVVNEIAKLVDSDELLGDISMHISDPEEGELAEDDNELNSTKCSTAKAKDNSSLQEKSDSFSFKNCINKSTPLSFVSEGKYQKKGVSPLLRPKYDNYRELCAAELHCTVEENKEKLSQRAKRFGLDVQPEVQISQEELNSLYNSLGISPDDLNAGRIKYLRLDTIHIRGVEEMNSSDVVQYFDGFQPWSIEWINDHSCNVLFKDEHYSAKALLNLSVEIKVDEENVFKNKGGDEELLGSNENVNSDNSYRDKENMADEAIQMEVDKHLVNQTAKEVFLLKIPVPPGSWRTGRSCSKAETVLMRFATKDDRKLPGAEKRSLFYKKYGNPNYGGLKGLISSSRKRKFQSVRPKLEAGNISTENASGSRANTKTMSNSDDEGNTTTVREKRVRMKMYADDIEGPWQKVTNRISSLKRHEVSSDHVENSEFSSTLTSATKQDVNSRFNIWTPIAEKMAKESQLAEEQSNYFGKTAQAHQFFQHDSSSNSPYVSRKCDDVFDLREKLKKMRCQNTKMRQRSPLSDDKTFDSDDSD